MTYVRPAALLALLFFTRAVASEDWLAAYRVPTARIVGEATAGTFAWQRLAELTDRFGHRLSGSPELEVWNRIQACSGRWASAFRETPPRARPSIARLLAGLGVAPRLSR